MQNGSWTSQGHEHSMTLWATGLREGPLSSHRWGLGAVIPDMEPPGGPCLLRMVWGVAERTLAPRTRHQGYPLMRAQQS